MMHGFAIVIGKCAISPASPKLALLLVMWMYGTAPGISYEEYRQAYIDAGGQSQVAEIEKCFLDFPLK